MDEETVWWYLIVGGVLIFMGVAATTFKRLPLSAAMFYLAIGYALGPSGLGLLQLDLARDAHILRPVTEVALLVSLFAIGLRLRLPLFAPMWTLPLRLGFVAMVLTIPLLTLVGVLLLDLDWGPSLLLAAILAPTDPVLAHDVGVQDSDDLDLLRFSLSGEGGLNDGIALPFVLLGLALCTSGAPHGNEASGWRIAFEAIAGIPGGLVIGGLLGWMTTKSVAWLRTRHAQALGLEGFFALGLIGLAYGAALLVHCNGFVAVFAAGVAMRGVEHRASGSRSAREAIGTVDSEDVVATASDPRKAHAFMAESVLGFTIELERIAEVVVMMIVGNVLATSGASLFTWQSAVLIAALFIVVRPLAVEASLLGSNAAHAQRRLMSWFGIRGIGSFYYLALALESMQQRHMQDLLPLVPLTLAVITSSVIVHGISATPLMNWYHRIRKPDR
ncbi:MULTISPECIES: cation:proton antiporter [Paraburkholderia]|uniref:Sodium/proton antiporter, CPA1 family n=2 Tax=Paraburkholderia TaxID=1822464 RepID=A0A7Z7FJM5_9BURK|nr:MULTISPECIES: cation:proton antiporter [Paraburkholderia]AUT62589.1 cation transporter [Paraburkholderia terrae]SDI59657.1 sodium/proton antiporter, CPA1 family [Paraburkholderia steynii]